jgi:hypothetical protein
MGVHNLVEASVTAFWLGSRGFADITFFNDGWEIEFMAMGGQAALVPTIYTTCCK